MAVEIAGKVVEREINESDHQALIDEFIRKWVGTDSELTEACKAAYGGSCMSWRQRKI